MKEEEWREPLYLNLLRSGSPRLSISDISNWNTQYSASPNGSQLGQLVFALNASTGATCMGQCVPGIQLIPWGLCCQMCCCGTRSSACSAASCTTCGFCLSTGTFVALGSVGGCGATLFRRIN
jgi:hypothetical protein